MISMWQNILKKNTTLKGMIATKLSKFGKCRFIAARVILTNIKRLIVKQRSKPDSPAITPLEFKHVCRHRLIGKALEMYCG